MKSLLIILALATIGTLAVLHYEQPMTYQQWHERCADAPGGVK